MKNYTHHFIILLILGISRSGFSQDYAPFYEDRDSYFNDLNQVIHITQTETDSLGFVYHNYPEIRFCFPEPPEPVVLNLALLRNPVSHDTLSGRFTFTNLRKEPFILETKTGSGDSWIMFSLQDSFYLEATHEQTVFSSVFESEDSIKIIRLHAYDTSGASISHPWDNQEIHLSQHHGLVYAMDFDEFPYTEETLTLAGISNPDLGIPGLSKEQFFQLTPGTEIQFRERSYTYSSSSSTETETIYRWIILEIINPYTLTYRIEQSKIYTREVINYGEIFKGRSFRKERINKKIQPFVLADAIPYYHDSSGYSHYLYDTLFHRWKKRLYYTQVANPYPGTNWSGKYDSEKDCFCELCYISDAPHYVDMMQGTGVVSFSQFPFRHRTSRQVIYISDSTGTYGTPADFHAAEFPPVDSLELPEYWEEKATFFPNPVRNRATLNIPDKMDYDEITTEIFSTTGEVDDGYLREGRYFDLSRLKPGFYVLRVIEENEILAVIKFVKI